MALAAVENGKTTISENFSVALGRRADSRDPADSAAGWRAMRELQRGEQLPEAECAAVSLRLLRGS